jgi:lipopolysaccharide biosynthesis glycosyltransferase
MRGLDSFTLAVDLKRFNETYTYGRLKYVPVVTQARLLLPGLLPCREKIIWIDLDAFVVGDLYPAWNTTQLPDCGIAGRELSTSFFDSHRATKHFRWNEIFGKAFNAGVVVLDLSRLRDNHFERLVEHFAVKLGLDDQFTLNMACNGTYTRLEAGMNIFQREDYGFPTTRNDWIVVHFLGVRKPWLSLKAESPEFQEIWEVNRVAFDEALIDSNNQKT